MKSKYIKTVNQINELKPRSERYEVADATLRPLRLVVFPSGAKSWVYRYRLGGRTRKLTLDCGATDLARARALGGDAMNKIAAKIDPGVEKQEKKQAGDLTVEGLINRYLDPKRKRKRSGPLRSAGEVERILRKELDRFKNRHPDGISTFEAKKLIDDVSDRGVVMANRTLTHCKGLYGFAVKEHFAETNPFAGLDLAAEESRDRVLSMAELAAVWNSAGPLGEPFTAIIRLLILTGQRLNEIACLRRNEINFEKRQIELPGSRTKNGRAHIVPLADPAFEILQSVKKIDGEPLVFGRRFHWFRIRARLGEGVGAIERWTLHDLRRTMATHCAEDLKIQPHVIDKALNHSSGVVRGVMAIYNRADLLDERRGALDAWASFVLATVEGKQSNVVAMRGGR
jgi:integrase